MNYKKHYDLLIEKALNRADLKGYYEVHHIIPKCMGGSNDCSNLVRLTAREHYLAHWLLFEEYKTKELAYAFHRMHFGNKKTKRKKISSRAYEELRKFQSELWAGENNPAKRKEVREKISKAVSGEKNGMYGRKGELNPAYGMKHSKEFLRKKQLIHSNVIMVAPPIGDIILFQCVKDCAEYYNVTTKGILYRINSDKPAKFGKFKGFNFYRFG